VSATEDATPNRQTRFVCGIFYRTVPGWHRMTPIPVRDRFYYYRDFQRDRKRLDDDACEDLIKRRKSQ